MAAPPRKRWSRSRPLAELVLKTLDPLAARQGFGEASLLLRWDEIVGARVAAMCQPIGLKWPPRAKNRAPDKPQESATLILRVEPGFGLDIQHMGPALMERVNTHLGWRCVARVSMRQEPLVRAAPKPRRKAPSDPAVRARAAAAVEGVTEEGLAAALVRLGENALAGR